MRKLFFFLFAFLLCATAQAQVSTRSAGKIVGGATLPATCQPASTAVAADVFVKTGTSAGLYFCSGPNVWTAVDAGGKRVSTQFDKTNNSTLSDITGLSVNVAAGRTYRFEAVLYTTSTNTAGVKFAIGGTATATAVIYQAVNINANTLVGTTARATALGTAVGDVTAVTAAYCRITGTITVNAAGTLTAQFAQNSAQPAQTSSVLVGSAFTVNEIL